MLPLSSPTPMLQGSFLRGAPGRLSTSLYASVSRRISGVGIARCSDGYVSSQSINPPPSPPQQSGTTQLPDSALPALAPLPSEASRNERVRFERSDSSSSNNERFRSVGSRSEPSLPSIPGKFSKYSKPISKLYTESGEKRAERRDKKAFRKPMGDIGAEPDWNVVPRDDPSSPASGAAATTKARKSRLPPEFPDWMEQYKYSYSEEPTAPIIGFRQHPWSPFGPADMVARPWTGSAPLKPSKKKRPEFDSFNPPPLNKKGVKYVQRPGPFPPGEGPKPAKTREEILGKPLTPLEISELVATVNKGSKQLNLGRDGLTHNMLDVVHNHWKRSVLCKIKCKGVPTIDMDNVARVIEERTGGVIIHRTGGVIYLFRGRNYNYKDRPKIPIMLWKPPDPIYPRLIQSIPEGLTDQEAKSLRAKGRRVAPLCKLSKNGVYLNLAADVRAQFEIDEVVRVDCEGMNPTDYKKIGAKLKELVPCTLLSFEKEQIIMCRKKPVQVETVQLVQDEDENPSDDLVDNNGSTTTTGLPFTEQYLPIENENESELVLAEDGGSVMEGNPETGTSGVDKNDATSVTDGTFTGGPSVTVTEGSPQVKSSVMDGNLESEVVVLDRNTKHAGSVADVTPEDARSLLDECTEDDSSFRKEISKNQTSVPDGNISLATSASDMNTGGPIILDYVDVLWQKAIEEGKALQLDNKTADPDVVLKKAAELSDVLEAPFSEERGDSEQRAAYEMLENERNAEENDNSAQVPPTSPFDVTERLRVDELAKLLAP